MNLAVSRIPVGILSCSGTKRRTTRAFTDWYLGMWTPNHMFYYVNAQEPGGPKAANSTFIMEFQF